MALDAFQGVGDAQTLVGMARRRAGSPDLHLDTSGNETVAAPAYLELQFILDNLALSYDWPFARVARSLSIGSGARSITLPSSFWRVSINDPLWIIDCNGNRTRTILGDEDTFFDHITTPAQTRGRPERFWVQKSSQTLFVDPTADQDYVGEFHFQPWQVPLSDISDKPWFPWSEYLVSALAVKLCLNQDDTRMQAEAALALSLMTQIRRSLSEQGERTATIQLNKSFFRRPLQL